MTNQDEPGANWDNSCYVIQMAQSMLSGAQEALCHPISTRCCFFIEAICCEARSSVTMHGQHLWTLWAMESPQLWAQWSGHLFMSTAVNCFHILQSYRLTNTARYTVTPNRRPGTWGAAVHRLAKQQKHSLRCWMATNLPGVQAMKLRMCENWQKLNVCVDA